VLSSLVCVIVIAWISPLAGAGIKMDKMDMAAAK
jgi:hypothetical protein